MRARTNGKKSTVRPAADRGQAAQQVVLRLPSPVLDRLDLAVRRRAVKIPRHTWLLEAVMEKLTRELPESGDHHGS